MKTPFSTWYFAALAWLAASALALAQPNNGPPSMTSLYGTSPSSPPNALGSQRSGPTPVVPLSSGGNGTAGTSGNAVGALTAQGSVSTPGGALPPIPVGANVPVIPGLVGAPGQNPADSPDLSQLSVAMPSSMDVIDNQHKLEPNDMFMFRINEDGDPAVILLVDEAGNVNVPYLGLRSVKGLTLRDVANAIKKDLLDGVPATAGAPAVPSYYKNATVLLAQYMGERSRGQINIIGPVVKPGMIPVPTDRILTLWDVITQAGGFTPLADETQVTLIHHDPADPTNPAKNANTLIDVAKSLANGNPPGNIVQTGDFIIVQSKSATSHYYTISGEVNHPGPYQLSGEPPTTVSSAIQLAGGFTDWAKEDKVKLEHYKDGKRTEQIVDVESILREGRIENDVKLQPDDVIIVEKALWKID